MGVCVCVCVNARALSARGVSTEVGGWGELRDKTYAFIFYEAENMPLYYPTINVV